MELLLTVCTSDCTVVLLYKARDLVGDSIRTAITSSNLSRDGGRGCAENTLLPSDKMEHQDSTTAYCFSGASDVEGLGTFAAVDLPSGQELFREAAFLVPRSRSLTTLVGSNNALSAEICDGLSAINVQHKHCPACIKLVPSDTGGTLRGSEDSFRFAKAYASASKLTRAGVLELGAAFGHGGAHAVADVVWAEVAILRRLDPELRLMPAEELECAIHR